MRAAVEAEGRDPGGLGVVGNLPSVVDDTGAVDLEATMAAVPALTAAGVSDFRGNVRLGATDEQALDELSRYVEAFRSATA